MSQLGKAISIAAKVHEDMLDKGGKPYILHPIRIMMRLRTDDQELMSMAILHDVIEDSDWTLEQFRAEGFSERVLKGLDSLTHRLGEPYEDYIKRIASNFDAVLCKLEDLRDNSDITRLKGIAKKDIERMEKYNKAFLYLSKVKQAHTEIYK
jgi:(p)ppGpp synthase/HD superfamily hydrolase